MNEGQAIEDRLRSVAGALRELVELGEEELKAKSAGGEEIQTECHKLMDILGLVEGCDWLLKGDVISSTDLLVVTKTLSDGLEGLGAFYLRNPSNSPLTEKISEIAGELHALKEQLSAVDLLAS